MTGPAISVRVQRQDFDLAAEVAAMSEGRGDIGAIVTFSGLCRDEAGTLGALELEHYPGMAEAEIRRVCETAAERFGLIALTAIHRHGRILAWMKPCSCSTRAVCRPAHNSKMF